MTAISSQLIHIFALRLYDAAIMWGGEGGGWGKNSRGRVW